MSTATIRSTNAKETKDKRNREKLLAGPVGSDMSIAAQDMDLEMDYYDYNVVNAGAAPGSYLGKKITIETLPCVATFSVYSAQT